jgi:four helix bundle protein
MGKSHKDLLVWQKSIDLVAEIYKLTEYFPKTEIFGITNQMRRAAVSIPANIAEGSARGHRQELRQFVKIAFASGVELETHMIIAKRLGFVEASRFEKADVLTLEVLKMTNALSSSLSRAHFSY